MYVHSIDVQKGLVPSYTPKLSPEVYILMSVGQEVDRRKDRSKEDEWTKVEVVREGYSCSWRSVGGCKRKGVAGGLSWLKFCVEVT